MRLPEFTESCRGSYGELENELWCLGGSPAFVASLSARFQASVKGSIDGSTYGMTVTRGVSQHGLSEPSAG